MNPEGTVNRLLGTLLQPSERMRFDEQRMLHVIEENKHHETVGE